VDWHFVLFWMGRQWRSCVVGFVTCVLFVFVGLQLFGMCFYASILDQKLDGRRFMASFCCGLVSKTRKDLVILTRKVLITNILDLSLDMNFYASIETCSVWWFDLFNYPMF
jgi:hypothetical protein